MASNLATIRVLKILEDVAVGDLTTHLFVTLALPFAFGAIGGAFSLQLRASHDGKQEPLIRVDVKLPQLG